jgi:hypothetical protein
MFLSKKTYNNACIITPCFIAVVERADSATTTLLLLLHTSLLPQLFSAAAVPYGARPRLLERLDEDS